MQILKTVVGNGDWLAQVTHYDDGTPCIVRLTKGFDAEVTQQTIVIGWSQLDDLADLLTALQMMEEIGNSEHYCTLTSSGDEGCPDYPERKNGA